MHGCFSKEVCPLHSSFGILRVLCVRGWGAFSFIGVPSSELFGEYIAYSAAIQWENQENGPGIFSENISLRSKALENNAWRPPGEQNPTLRFDHAHFAPPTRVGLTPFWWTTAGANALPLRVIWSCFLKVLNPLYYDVVLYSTV